MNHYILYTNIFFWWLMPRLLKKIRKLTVKVGIFSNSCFTAYLIYKYIMKFCHDFVIFFFILFVFFSCVKFCAMYVVLLCKPFVMYFCSRSSGTRICYLSFNDDCVLGHKPFIKKLSKNGLLGSNCKNAEKLLYS